MEATTDHVKLTEYSHGAGCGCKISPAMLDEILSDIPAGDPFKNLLVGNTQRDDAAVMTISKDQAVISTTDFFMPIVDDPFDFGRIAAANALSDIYAMGGTPLMAIAILGWPIDKLATSLAGQVITGGQSICKEAGIPLAGGHSIDCPEPIFGLAVTGLAHPDQIKRNNTVKQGDLIYLTKPLGTGIVTTASKKGYVRDEGLEQAIEVMTTLNNIGHDLASQNGVHAMTDVTGFGLLGHLIEMIEGSGFSAEINMSKVPFLNGLDHYMELGSIPGGTKRNWNSYGNKVGEMDERTQNLLCDPQTSGGLLLSVDPEQSAKLSDKLEAHGISGEPIGSIIAKNNDGKMIEINA